MTEEREMNRVVYWLRFAYFWTVLHLPVPIALRLFRMGRSTRNVE